MGVSRRQMAAVMDRVFEESLALGTPVTTVGIEALDELGADIWRGIRHALKTGGNDPHGRRHVRESITRMVAHCLCPMRAQVDVIDGIPPITAAAAFVECRALREAGQKEYAHDDGNAMANFEDDSEATGASREAVLTIFANKHWRGIRAWVGGHRSQRENVRGRLYDMIVYLCLLRGMIDERDGLIPSK